VWRVRRLASTVRESIDENYASIAPDTNKDEISAVAFMFNDAAKEIHGRATGITDRDDAMRRFVVSASEHVAKPLAAMDAKLARGRLSAEDHAAIAQEANDLSTYLANLVAAARLRGRGEPVKRDEIDLTSALRRVADRLAPMAEAAGVSIRIAPSATPVTVLGDSGLFDQAIGNLVHNAIRYNRPGGTVTATVTRADNGRFQLRIVDNGLGVTDEEMKGLMAIRRFRGDEGRDRRPGVPGLGLAVAREVIERCGLQLELEKPASGGFAVTVAG